MSTEKTGRLPIKHSRFLGASIATAIAILATGSVGGTGKIVKGTNIVGSAHCYTVGVRGTSPWGRKSLLVFLLVCVGARYPTLFYIIQLYSY